MKRTMIILMALVLMAGAANAQDILWDQTAGYEGWQQGFFNLQAGAPPFGMTTFTVNDIVVPAGGWTVDSIKVYYDGFNPGWAGAITAGYLFLEPKTGSVPTSIPAGGFDTPMTCVDLGNGFLEVQASTLALVLNEGEYWIGITPATPNADNIHVSVAAVGDDSPSYDTGGFPVPMWAAWSPDLDGAMLIEGLGPVATESVSMGSVKALYR